MLVRLWTRHRTFMKKFKLVKSRKLCVTTFFRMAGFVIPTFYMRIFIGLILWGLLLVLCWPLALILIILFPLVWLVLLPFRIIGLSIELLFKVVSAILLFPFKVLKGG